MFQQIRLHRTKVSRLLLKVVAKSISDDRMRRLKDVPYSVIIDESTDNSTAKYMAICVRYYNVSVQEIKTEFLGLVEVPTTTGEVLFSELKFFLESNYLRIKNMVGIGTDGASNLCGIRNSVFSRIKEIVPNIVPMCVTRCIYAPQKLLLNCRHAWST